jgi:hypothetical protein
MRTTCSARLSHMEHTIVSMHFQVPHGVLLTGSCGHQEHPEGMIVSQEVERSKGGLLHHPPGKQPSTPCHTVFTLAETTV